LLAAKDKECKPTGEQGKNKYLHMQRTFEVAHELAAGTTPAPFPRGKSSFHETAAFKEVEHEEYYLRDSDVGPRYA
jgi:hypothetical protein